MKRTITFCAMIGVLTLSGVLAWAINEGAVPICTPGPWIVDSHATVSITSLVPTEPLTLGVESKITVAVSAFPGQRHYTDSCNFTHYETWPITLQSVTWEASSTSPLSGSAPLECEGYYTATFIPQAVGPRSLTFHANAVSSDPDWTGSTNVSVGYNVLPQKRLAYWNFNGNWIGDAGQAPASAENLLNPTDWNGGVLELNDLAAGRLRYAAREADGTANLTRNIGTVRFWFKPKWSSGTGPGGMAKLVEFDSASRPVSPDQSVWSLRVNGSGTAIELSSAQVLCSSATTTHFSRTISWTANQWHQVVVTYSPTETQLYVDGAPYGAAGSGMTRMLLAADGMNIGSGADGDNPARGYFDELETFNHPLTALVIQQDYQVALALDTDNDGLSNFQELVVGTDINDPDTDGDGCLDGSDDFPLIFEGCHYEPGDTTPPNIQLIQPANAVWIP